MSLLRFDRKQKRVRLGNIPTTPPGGMSRDKAEKRLGRLSRELYELQELMFGAKTHGLLVVLQGRDTAGKDGTIKHVVGALNPRGVSVTSFGVPTEEELAHDFLWRIHPHAPGRGRIAIFNRSHFEDVLVVRVHELVLREVWEPRFEQINAFEKILQSSGTIVLKFFLHISNAEQEKRLRDREADPTKAWKLNVNDWEERALWDDYTAAYAEVVGRCSTAHAPWFVIPSDAKWYRNLSVAEAICRELRSYRAVWEKKLQEDSRRGREALDAWRHDRAPEAASAKAGRARCPEREEQGGKGGKGKKGKKGKKGHRGK